MEKIYLLSLLALAVSAPAYATNTPAANTATSANAWSFLSLDTNGDGMISTQELTVSGRLTASNFEEIDANGDGRINNSEYDTWVASPAAARLGIQGDARAGVNGAIDNNTTTGGPVRGTASPRGSADGGAASGTSGTISGGVSGSVGTGGSGGSSSASGGASGSAAAGNR